MNKYLNVFIGLDTNLQPLGFRNADFCRQPVWPLVSLFGPQIYLSWIRSLCIQGQFVHVATEHIVGKGEATSANCIDKSDENKIYIAIKGEKSIQDWRIKKKTSCKLQTCPILSSKFYGHSSTEIYQDNLNLPGRGTVVCMTALSPGTLGRDISANRNLSPLKASSGPVPTEIVCLWKFTRKLFWWNKCNENIIKWSTAVLWLKYCW